MPRNYQTYDCEHSAPPWVTTLALVLSALVTWILLAVMSWEVGRLKDRIEALEGKGPVTGAAQEVSAESAEHPATEQ